MLFNIKIYHEITENYFSHTTFNFKNIFKRLQIFLSTGNSETNQSMKNKQIN